MSWLRFVVLALIAGANAHAQQPLVLRGTVKGAQNNSYIEVPFDVPSKTQRLSVSFRYTGREDKTTLDIGIEDPHGFRGWSGGNKSSFTISATDATPSYLPGELIPGTWKLLIGVPNIRPQGVASYEASIVFEPPAAGKTESFSEAPLRQGPGWYRGDLHMHTAHSDGHCKSQSGKQVPCPVFLTLEAATRRGLDFIAVTDHNTTSHYDALRELQPYFDQLLLIPGREVTTFVGHANVFGTTDFVDFRVGSGSVPTMNSMFEQASSLGALISINHPDAPTGEVCMGCGWQGTSDLRLVNAIEAVNGGSEEGPYSGVPFWERQLNAGYRVTAIGGSDNHDASLPPERAGSIGAPTTVVYAAGLSVSGILEGIRLGHVFVDLTASKDRLLDVFAESGARKAIMGQTLQANSGDAVEVTSHVVACQGSRLRLLVDGTQASSALPREITSADQTLNIRWRSDGRRHWLRADVVSSSGKLEMLGNPIYVNFAQ